MVLPAEQVGAARGVVCIRHSPPNLPTRLPPSAHQSKIECAPVQCACVAAPSVLYLLQPIYHSSRIRGRSAENRESVVVPSNVARERDLEKKKEGDNRKKGKRNCLLYGITCRTSGGGEGCRVHPAFTAKSSIHSSVNSLS